MKKSIALFAIGGSLYPAIELLSRGWTDISMSFAGGLCLCLIDRVCNSRLHAKKLWVKCCAGSAIITGVELAVGVVVNLVLKMDVWDYSHLPLNLFGQVCLPFSVLWFLITLPALGICRLLEHTRLAGARQRA